MEITSNYSITQLFLGKDIKIFVTEDKYFYITLRSIRDFFEDDDWQSMFYFFNLNIEDWEKFLGIKKETTWEYISTLYFNFISFKQYTTVINQMKNVFMKLFKNLQIDNNKKEFIVNGITITPEIWNYVIYLLNLSCGEEKQKPLTFDSPEAKAFFLQEQKNAEKIRKLREKNSNTQQGSDGLLKTCLTICYSFPSFTLDYLFNQTMAQIRWLYTMAAGETNYRVNAQIFAAGNMKKGSKLEFFIK